MRLEEFFLYILPVLFQLAVVTNDRIYLHLEVYHILLSRVRKISKGTKAPSSIRELLGLFQGLFVSVFFLLFSNLTQKDET